MGHHVIMGRKNFESIPERFRPFRIGLISHYRQIDYQAEGCVVLNSLEAALKSLKKMVIRTIHYWWRTNL